MAIKTYKKGIATKLSANFKSTEFDCHGSGCCSSTLIDEDLVNYLQKIRTHFNKPVKVSSAYRCEKHNKNVGGATGSRHVKGQAADIYIDGVKPAEIAKYAESLGVLGIGLYETAKDGYFVHVDTRTKKAFWYGQAQASRTTFGGTPIKEEVKIDTSAVKDVAADPKVIWDFLKTQGLNDYGIAGLMGNLYAESGLKPTNLQGTYEKKLGYTDAEYTAAVDQKIYKNFTNDSAGYGLAQWTFYSRKQDMLTFHIKRGKSIGDLQTQLEFLVYELQSSYKTSVWEVLKNATSVLEASNAVLLKFEKPSNQSVTVQNKRAAYSQKYYDDYALKTPVLAPSDIGYEKLKYMPSNPPLVCLQTQWPLYNKAVNTKIKGIVWHSTGMSNTSLKRYIQPSNIQPKEDTYGKEEWLDILGENTNKNDWNHIPHQSSVNCWIGKLNDGTVSTIQTMPWTFKAFNCGTGSLGSCNDGWIQLEICEDNLVSKSYFEEVYKEACEITAYLCKLYDLDPNGYSSHVGIQVPVILCHAEAYKLGLASNCGDVLHWFKKYGKNMNNVRSDVNNLINLNQEEKPTISESTNNSISIYKVSKTWLDSKSYGIFNDLNVAKETCDKIGNGCNVFDANGLIIYPPQNIVITPGQLEAEAAELNIGDAVKLLPGAKYTSGQSIPKWVFQSKLYLREKRKDTGSYVISTQKTGAVTGAVKPEYVVAYETNIEGSSSGAVAFTPYLVKITATILNVRQRPSTSSPITTQVKTNQIFTIVAEDGNWGKLKSGVGWICLDYTTKI